MTAARDPALAAPLPARSRGAAAKALVAALVLALAAWGGLFVGSTSRVFEGERYFLLMDDAMISMTYARSLVEGHGLDWSRRGDPVEGFSHPLWLGVLVAAQLLPLGLPAKSLTVQIGGLLFWILIVPAVARTLDRHSLVRNAAGRAAALALAGGSFALAHWTLLGMETGLQALLLVLLVDAAFEVLAEPAPRAWGRGLRLGAIASALYLLRMDTMVPILCALAWTGWCGRRAPPVRRALGAASALLATTALALQAGRWALFHELLPNTYYLKLAGTPLSVRLARGGASLAELVVATLPFWLAVAWALARGRGEPRRWLLGALVAGGLGYSVWVGGDVWDWTDPVGANRFIAPVLPLAAILAGTAVADAGEALARRGASRARAGAAAAALATVLWLALNGMLWGERAERLRRLATLRDPPGQAVSSWIVLERLLAFRALVEPGATVATVWGGIPAYFTDYRMVDTLGYNDRHIARLPAAITATGFDPERPFTPGHAKWDYRYVVEAHRPDAFFQAFGPPAAEVEKPLRAAGYRPVDGFWLDPASGQLTRRGRRLVRWSRPRAAAGP